MLNDTMKEVPKKDILMIMGDWNGKVGSDNSGSCGYEDIMGRYAYGEEMTEETCFWSLRLTMIYISVTPDFNRRTAENGHGSHVTTGPRIWLTSYWYVEMENSNMELPHLARSRYSFRSHLGDVQVQDEAQSQCIKQSTGTAWHERTWGTR